MQRIPYPELETLPETMRKMLEGTPLNVVRIGAHASPQLFEAQGRLGYAIADPAVLAPTLREAVILRVASLSESEYELHHHLPLARAAGLSDEEIEGIVKADYAALDPGLAAACRFTDEVVPDLVPSEPTLSALREHYADRTVINLVLAIGCYMTIARLAAVTGIELDEASLNHLPSELAES